MAHHSRIRWYNPKLEDFEWRRVPRSDEEVLKLLEGSPYSPTCKETYEEWRQLGAHHGSAHPGGRGSPTARGGRSLEALGLDDPSDSLWSSQAACSTASATKPRLLKSATVKPSSRLRTNISGSRYEWYPEGRFTNIFLKMSCRW